MITEEETPDDENTEDHAPADDGVDRELAEIKLREWFKQLRKFLTEQAGHITLDMGATYEAHDSAAIGRAREQAVVAAFDAARRIADRLAPAPAPPFRIDTTRFGRDN